jgi:EpsI family protein
MKTLNHRVRVVCILLALVASLTCFLHATAQPHSAPARLGDFPLIIGDYLGRDLPVDESAKNILETPNVLMREYVGAEGVAVTLSIVYYERYRVAFHLPEGCMTGVGSIIAASGTEHISDDPPIIANKLILKQSEGAEFVYYFFMVGDLITPSYPEMRLKLMTEHLKRRNVGAALVRFSAKTNGEDEDDALRVMRDFGKQLASAVPACLGYCQPFQSSLRYGPGDGR